MEGKPKGGKRKRISFRYDPRLFSRLESIYSQVVAGKPVEQAAFHDGQQAAYSPSRLILVGYGLEARKPVLIKEGHILVCGMPQKSGKTTCIEGLLSRWPGNGNRKKKIIAFITKRGENSFPSHRKAEPFINTEPDPDFLSPVVESMLVVNRRPQISKKINLIVAELCNNAKSLKQALKNVTRMQKKVGYSDKLKRDTCIALHYYLTDVLPRQDYNPNEEKPDFKTSLNFEYNGDNNNVVINLSEFSQELQTLVMGSVAYELLNHHRDAILVVPDGWKMFDTDGTSLGRFHVESLIAEGPRNRNHVIIESTDIEDIPLHIRRQMYAIVLGYQAWGDEAKIGIRALRNLASQMRQNRTMKGLEKPFLTRFDIQRLRVGEFYAFPSLIEDQGVWKANKVSAIPSQTSKE
jgi:hypothetical protein